MRLASRSAFVFVALLVVGVLPVGTAHAANTYKVSTFNDPPPGACVPGDCSLREAVIAANGSPGADTIRLSAGAYNLTRTGTGGASEGDLDVTDDVTVNKIPGSGAVALVDGHGPLTTDRVFEVSNNADLVLHGVGARNGIAAQEGAPTDPRHGGGIRVNAGASLDMTGGVVAGNTAPNTASVGGGIYNEGQVHLTRVNVQTNKTDFGFGGGIWTTASGTTTVEQSVIRDNTSGFGGAFSGQGSTTILRSMLRGNGAELGGAGYISGAGSAVIQDSTITGNLVTDRGGAFRVRNGTLSITSSTISENQADADAGGIAVQDDAGAPPTSVTLRGTILAGNIDNGGNDKPDCYDQSGGLVLSSGANVVGNQNGCTITPTTDDHIGTSGSPLSAGLMGLAFNGGPLPASLTYALSPTSIALDNNSGVCSSTDQRGVPRNLGGTCDTGAYERVLCNSVLVNRVGTPGNDKVNSATLKPTSLADGFLGLSGNDGLKGAGGNDGMCGGPGNDVETGGPGNDKLTGGPGNDKLIGGIGNDTCTGGGGIDTAQGCEHKIGIP